MTNTWITKLIAAAAITLAPLSGCFATPEGSTAPPAGTSTTTDFPGGLTVDFPDGTRLLCRDWATTGRECNTRDMETIHAGEELVVDGYDYTGGVWLVNSVDGEPYFEPAGNN